MQLPTPIGRAGFTVMEVLVAASVLTVAISGAAFMMTSAYGAYRHQDRNMDLDRLVHDEMEKLTVTDYPELATDIRKARNPKDPAKDGSPTRDFVTTGSGEATVRYELEAPENDQEDWTPRQPPQIGPDGKPLQVIGQHRARLRASLKLQYWDPTFDQPTASDHGLVRATFEIKGDGVDKENVKYLARNVNDQWKNDLGSP